MTIPKINRQTFITAEMKPDVYDGDSCDQVRPRWWAQAEGDMEGSYVDVITFDSKQFPPGTRVTLSLPCCPECHQVAELCEQDDHCDFDWKQWTMNEYS